MKMAELFEARERMIERERKGDRERERARERGDDWKR